MTKTQKRLIQLKGKKKLREFAAEVGTLQSTMHNYLHGRKLREDVIIKVCNAYGVSSDWLLGIADEYTIYPTHILADMRKLFQNMDNSLTKIESMFSKAETTACDLESGD